MPCSLSMLGVSIDLTNSWVMSLGADVRPQVSLEVRHRSLVIAEPQLSRCAYPDHDRAHAPSGRQPRGVVLPAREVLEAGEAAGEHEPHVLVGGLGPSVEVVRQGQRVRVKHLHLAPVNQGMLVPVGGVVGACHRHAPDAGVVGGPQHVVGHLDVLLLVEEVVYGLA